MFSQTRCARRPPTVDASFSVGEVSANNQRHSERALAFPKMS
jgi:hypothetical protein